MRRRRSSIGRWASVLALTAALVAGAYAFTAANTVPPSKAGDGSGAISGYTLSSVHYNLNASSPTTIDTVTFTLDVAPPSGSTIKAQLYAAGSWYSCSNTGTAVTCTTTGAAVTDATQLRVVIAQ